MTERRRRAAVVALALIVAACGAPGGGGDTSPDASSSAPPSPGASASPTASPRSELASLAPEAEWRAVLHLISGPGGSDEGSFDVGARYRIRLDCLGAGRITVRVATRARASRQCDEDALSEPVVVRGVDGGRLRVRVTATGEVQWVVLLEVPR
jgi:hypothetical protein